MKSFPWILPLGLNPNDVIKWQMTFPEGKNFLAWCLSQGHLNEEKYLAWAKDHYGLPKLNSSFEMEAPLEQWNLVKNYLPSHCTPVAFLENVLYIAGLEPVEPFQQPPFQLQFMLGRVQELIEWQKRTEGTSRLEAELISKKDSPKSDPQVAKPPLPQSPPQSKPPEPPAIHSIEVAEIDEEEFDETFSNFKPQDGTVAIQMPTHFGKLKDTENQNASNKISNKEEPKNESSEIKLRSSNSKEENISFGTPEDSLSGNANIGPADPLSNNDSSFSNFNEEKPPNFGDPIEEQKVPSFNAPSSVESENLNSQTQANNLNSSEVSVPVQEEENAGFGDLLKHQEVETNLHSSQEAPINETPQAEGDVGFGDLLTENGIDANPSPTIEAPTNNAPQSGGDVGFSDLLAEQGVDASPASIPETPINETPQAEGDVGFGDLLAEQGVDVSPAPIPETPIIETPQAEDEVGFGDLLSEQGVDTDPAPTKKAPTNESPQAGDEVRFGNLKVDVKENGKPQTLKPSPQSSPKPSAPPQQLKPNAPPNSPKEGLSLKPMSASELKQMVNQSEQTTSENRSSEDLSVVGPPPPLKPIKENTNTSISLKPLDAPPPPPSGEKSELGYQVSSPENNTPPPSLKPVDAPVPETTGFILKPTNTADETKNLKPVQPAQKASLPDSDVDPMGATFYGKPDPLTSIKPPPTETIENEVSNSSVEGHDDIILHSINEVNSIDDIPRYIFNRMSPYFENKMILLFVGEELKPWKWSSSWSSKPESILPIPLKDPSVFRIVFETNTPYHGYVVSNPINDQFFNSWAKGNHPAHLTICPLNIEKNLVGMVLGTKAENGPVEIAIEPVEAIAHETSRLLLKHRKSQAA